MKDNLMSNSKQIISPTGISSKDFRRDKGVLDESSMVARVTVLACRSPEGAGNRAAAELLDVSIATILLNAGEMTADEMTADELRAVKAVLNERASAIRLEADGMAPHGSDIHIRKTDHGTPSVEESGGKTTKLHADGMRAGAALLRMSRTALVKKHGKLTTQQMRSVKAVLDWRARVIIDEADKMDPRVADVSELPGQFSPG